MVVKHRSLLPYLMFIVYHLQAYHSTLSAPNSLCKMALLPINTKFKGPAPPGGTMLSYCCVIRKNTKYYVFVDLLLKPISRFWLRSWFSMFVYVLSLITYLANGKLLVIHFSWR